MNFSDPFGLCPLCDIADVGFFLYSAGKALIQPSRENFTNAGLDAIGLLPVVPSAGMVRRLDGVADAVRGSRPRNAHLAGGVHPVTKIPFGADGFPDFSAVSIKNVEITFNGNRADDFKAANTAAGYAKTPKGYTWHHHQNGRTMQLVPTDIHRKTGHTGGHSIHGRQEWEEE